MTSILMQSAVFRRLTENQDKEEEAEEDE